VAIVVPIVADTSGLTKGLSQGGSRLKKFGKIAAVAAGAAAIGGLVKTLQIGTQKFVAQEKAVAQTNARLKSTGGIANVTARQVMKLSDAIAEKTGVDDDQIHAASNMLLTFTKIRNEVGKNNDIFNRATETVVDLSIAFDKDLGSTSIMLGKALNDPVKGITALSRAGVQFTEDQKKTIKSLVESGNVLGAQKMILKELETQVGGAGEAFGNTLPGQLSKAKQSFEVIAQRLAGLFLPTVANALKRLTGFLSAFGKQPTLRAKVDFIIGAFAGLVWSGAQTISNWWSRPKVQFEDNPANRLKVTIEPAGRDQVASWFRDFKNKMIAEAGGAGQGIGVALANAIFGGVSTGTRKNRGKIIADVAYLYSGAWVFEAGANFATNFWSGFSTQMRELGKGFPDLFKSIIRLYNPIEAGRIVGSQFKDAFNREVRRGGATGLSNVLTKAVKDAVQAARQGLAGAGAALGGTLATVLGATFTRPGGMAPGAITAEEREIEDKRLELEEARLKEAAAATEATEEDKLALREFYLNKEKTLRDRALSEEIANRQRGISDLIESFNKGLIGAGQFESELRGLIGADLGTELGTGFAGAFERELTSILNIVKEIVGISGAPTISAGGSGDITSTLKGENQRRFAEALSTWEANRKKRLDQATNFRKRKESDGGAKITDAERREINAIMQKWDASNPKPQRSAYGLALGGVLKKQVFTAGEAGPEAVMPLTGRGGVMLRDALGLNGQQGATYNITVNAGLGTNPDDLSRVIVESIKRYERRNGQVFQGPIATVSANAQGVLTTASGDSDFNRIVAARRG
jgi:acid phosphatase family membrane protein YuiD